MPNRIAGTASINMPSLAVLLEMTMTATMMEQTPNNIIFSPYMIVFGVFWCVKA